MMPYNQDMDLALTNLIVNYLPQNMTEKELFNLFSRIGAIESCKVMKDIKTGYSFGFGFINFVNGADATRAIKEINGLVVENKQLKVSYARPSGDDIKDTNLYVTNLPRTITEEQLEHMFGNFGRIVQKRILKDKITGMPRGVAFVRYDKRSQAAKAMQQMHEYIPEGCIEPIGVKIAEEHGKQKAAYYAGFHAGFSQSRDSISKRRQHLRADQSPLSSRTDSTIYNHIRNNGLNNNNNNNNYNLCGKLGNDLHRAIKQERSFNNFYRYNPLSIPSSVDNVNMAYNIGGGYY